MSADKVSRPGSEFGDLLVLSAPSSSGVPLEVDGAPDRDGEIEFKICNDDDAHYGDSHRAYLGQWERRALLQWLTAIDGAPAYVHALVDAWVTGGALDFRGAPVPADVQERVAAELARRSGGE